ADQQGGARWLVGGRGAAAARPATRGVAWAGFSKWRTGRRSGPATASARYFGEIVDEVEATIASAARRPASRANVSRLRSTDSGKASWTKPQASRPARSVRSSTPS